MTDAMPSPVRDAPRSAWRALALAGALALGGCGEEGGAGGGGSGGLTGTGGSTARMTIVGDYLYAIAGSDVQLFDVSAPATPLPWVQVRLGRDIETLFPHGDYLLVGASEGVYVMDNTDAASPVEIGRFVHATARDPVVAQGTHAYLTLRADFTRPPPATEDRMEVLDIADPSAPSLVTTVAMESPAGLAVRDDRLYVCDGAAGLKTFDVADPVAPILIDTVAEEHCRDMILSSDLLHVVAADGLRQYDLSLGVPRLLSEMPSVPTVYVADR